MVPKIVNLPEVDPRVREDDKRFLPGNANTTAFRYTKI